MEPVQSSLAVIHFKISTRSDSSIGMPDDSRAGPTIDSNPLVAYFAKIASLRMDIRTYPGVKRMLLHRILANIAKTATPPPHQSSSFALNYHQRRHYVINKMLATLTSDPATWTGSSLLSVTQITADGLELLFRVSQQMRDLVHTSGGDNRLEHAVLGTVFFEASTRTSCSFQAAMLRLGGKNIHVDGKGNTSAGQKGETLEDTIRCLECYTNVTVLRHPIQGSVGRVIANATKPVLNAGDGVGEHPTQALLDVFTIYNELKLAQQKKPLIVVLLGDLKHGRTVHSLAKLLVNSLGVVWEQQLTLRYCAPAGLEMPDYVQEYCSKFVNVQQETYTDMKEAGQDANVLYVTRVQRERFDTDEAYETVKGTYVVDQEFMKTTPKNMIVLHPLPRVDEISTNVDRDPRAAYFRQMENGMFVRMALLALVLGKSEAGK